MAQKRMFDKKVVESDKFIDLPNSSKALYFMAGMEADDKGFFQPRRLQKMCGFSDDDYKILIAKGFFITFESGVMVITDWNKNNWLDSRRVSETEYVDELNMLKLINQRYEFKLENDIAKPMLSEYSIEENSIDKNSIDNNDNIYNNWNENNICECITKDGTKCSRKSTYNINGKNYCNQHSKTILNEHFEKESKHKYGEYKNVLLTDKELQSLKSDYDNSDELIQYLDDYIEMKGYKAKSHYLCIKKWVIKAVKENKKEEDYWNE